MNATPAMCHHAETMFKADVIVILNMLIRTAAPRKHAYRM